MNNTLSRADSSALQKKEVRRIVRERVAALGDKTIIRQSEDVCRRISETEVWRQAGTVLLYSALPDELSLSMLIQKGWESGKCIVLPVVDRDSLLLRVYNPDRMAVQGRFGILEPTADCELVTDLGTIDLALIPGRAFDLNGDRLGRGKGYYDRLLPLLECPKWGVCFNCQMLKSVPADEWDVRMDKVFY